MKALSVPWGRRPKWSGTGVRPDKHPDAYDVFFNHPSVAPHVHSISRFLLTQTV